ncbi:hypothetical protein ACEQ8H_002884 [Pleosporales sp. CAS-2024a]
MATSMSTFTIPRKEIGAPSPPTHLKEVGTCESVKSSGDVSEESQHDTKPTRLGSQGAAGWALSDGFDRMLPPYRRYFGRSRRTLLIVILVALLCLLTLVIGLAVGLSGRSNNTTGSRARFIPLPNGAQTYTGDLTYYDPGLGACGIDSGDNDAVVAISHYTFDAAQKGSDPNKNPLCGRKIRATRTDGRTGKPVSIDVTVIDRCVGCEPTDLDVSPAMFDKMADAALGRVKVDWAWL